MSHVQPTSARGPRVEVHPPWGSHSPNHPSHTYLDFARGCFGGLLFRIKTVTGAREASDVHASHVRAERDFLLMGSDFAPSRLTRRTCFTPKRGRDRGSCASTFTHRRVFHREGQESCHRTRTGSVLPFQGPPVFPNFCGCRFLRGKTKRQIISIRREVWMCSSICSHCELHSLYKLASITRASAGGTHR